MIRVARLRIEDLDAESCWNPTDSEMRVIGVVDIVGVRSCKLGKLRPLQPEVTRKLIGVRQREAIVDPRVIGLQLIDIEALGSKIVQGPPDGDPFKPPETRYIAVPLLTPLLLGSQLPPTLLSR